MIPCISFLSTKVCIQNMKTVSVYVKNFISLSKGVLVFNQALGLYIDTYIHA